MTATPGTIANQPDVLSELLRAMRLTGGVFMDGQFTTPFGIISPARWNAQDQMARLRHGAVVDHGAFVAGDTTTHHFGEC